MGAEHVAGGGLFLGLFAASASGPASAGMAKSAAAVADIISVFISLRAIMSVPISLVAGRRLRHLTFSVKPSGQRLSTNFSGARRPVSGSRER